MGNFSYHLALPTKNRNTLKISISTYQCTEKYTTQNTGILKETDVLNPRPNYLLYVDPNLSRSMIATFIGTPLVFRRTKHPNLCIEVGKLW